MDCRNTRSNPPWVRWAHVLNYIARFDVQTVSQPYWNRSARDMAAMWVEWAADRHTKRELSLSVNDADLMRLPRVLRGSTNDRVHADDRRKCLQLLKECYIQGIAPPPGILLTTEAAAEGRAKPVWPELNDRSDLETYEKKLRKDVIEYLWNAFSKVHVVLIGYRRDEPVPIYIEVAKAHEALALETLAMLEPASDFAPKELTRIISNARQSMKSTAEQAAPSSTVTSSDGDTANAFNGTIGAFINLHSVAGATKVKTVGITCAHVMSRAMFGVKLFSKAKAPDIDLALIEVDPAVMPAHCNVPHQNVAFAASCVDSGVFQPGDRVYKFGAATGLTIGTLLDVDVSVERNNYHGAYLILPDPGTVFSIGGDSGALLAVYRNGVFTPFAVQVTSTVVTTAEGDEVTVSVGLSLTRERVSALAEGYDWSFVNPPHATANCLALEQIAASTAASLDSQKPKQ